MQIRLERLSVGVAGRTLVSDLNAVFLPRTLTSIAGPSGSGKSTLLATIAGLAPATSGSVHLEGLSPHNIALMSQTPAILAQRTVRDNVALGALAAGASYAAASETADRLLWELNLSHLADSRALQTSGGERQRLAILRVIAKGDCAILADEPTASLDPVSRSVVVDSLRAAADRGAIVLIATHDEYVVDACDRAITPWAQP